MSVAVAGFHGPDALSDGVISRPVYTSVGGTKPLIIVHELPGMTVPFVDYCRSLVAEGYRVTMPLLFSQPESRMTNAEIRRLCVSQEFRSLFDVANDKNMKDARPITAWLLHLTRVVIDQHPDRKVGVIGMCLTGGFALATIAEDGVAAAVACQPAYPFFRGIKTLGLSPAERDRASTRARGLTAHDGSACLQAYRHRWDVISRPSHIRAAKRIFGTALESHTIPGRGHSTVTADEPNRQVVEGIRAFLAAKL